MAIYTEKELAQLRDKQQRWLEKETPEQYTGSFVGQDEKGDPLLVLLFATISNALEKVVSQRFRGLPYRIEEMPPAQALGTATDAPKHPARSPVVTEEQQGTKELQNGGNDNRRLGTKPQ